MSRTDAEKEPKSDEILQLGNFKFLLKTKELLDSSGNAIALRSQSADVLAYLAAHSGTLVSKDALIDAVWADTFVTDDSLVQCIGDIRRALGDDDHKIVQTSPKKGYKLIATTVPVDATISAASPKAPVRRWVSVLSIAALAIFCTVAVWYYFAQTGSLVPRGDKPRIAVLPFDDFSTGEDKGYLSDAIAEGIITELARNSLISVTARNSSFRYRAQQVDMRQIGEELGVNYLLEGSKQKNGDALKVTVQLIDAHSGNHLWAHTYDQEIGDLFTVQDAIIKTVADRIGTRIKRPVPGADPDKVTALHLHLKARALVENNMNADVHAQVMELDRKAVEADPDAQYGYIGLAHGYRASAMFGWLDISRDEALKQGFEVAFKALEIAPDDPEVHYALARLYTESSEPEKANAAYNKAIQLNPSASRYLVASTDLLLYAGNAEEAIERLEQARGVDPFLGYHYHWQMAWALWEIDDCDGALESLLKMNQLRPSAHRMVAVVYACLGEVEKAQEAYKVYYSQADEPTISEQRNAWKGFWTGPGLERWLDHMRIAGMKD